MRRLHSHLLVQSVHHVAALSTCHTHAHEAHHRAALVAGSSLHSCTGCAGHEGHACIRIRESLQIANVFFVLFARFNAAYAEGNNLYAAQLAPFLAQHVIECIADFLCMTRQCTVAHALFTHHAKGLVQAGQQLSFQLAVNLAALIFVAYVAANIGIEQNRIGNLVAVLAKAADRDIHIQTDALVNNSEGNRAGSAIFVADDFLRIEEVHALILARIAAIGETLADLSKDILNTLHIQAICHDGRLRRGIISIFARLGAKLYNLAVFYDNHALTFVDGNSGAVADDVILCRSVGAASLAGGTLHALGNQNIRLHAFTVNKLFPLIAQYAASCA